jgi:hypothetical protein
MNNDFIKIRHELILSAETLLDSLYKYNSKHEDNPFSEQIWEIEKGLHNILFRKD